MLTSTFTCFCGIGEAAEQRLWANACLRWEHFAFRGVGLFSKRKSDGVLREIEIAQKMLALQRADYFIPRIPAAHRGRLFSDFVESTSFLDIETTGLSRTAQLTTAALYQAGTLHLYMNKVNLFDIVEPLQQSKLVVTFNGHRFDIPLLERALRMEVLVPHLDLLPVMRALGLQGGLKAIEKSLGIRRSTAEVNGQTAVALWRQFELAGDRQALIKLLEYNAEDVLALVDMFGYALKRSMDAFPMRPSLPARIPRPGCLARTATTAVQAFFDK